MYSCWAILILTKRATNCLSLLPRPNVCQLLRSCHLPRSHAMCSGGRQPSTEASVPTGFHLSALSGPQPDIPSDPVLHYDLYTASIRYSFHLQLMALLDNWFKFELRIGSIYSLELTCWVYCIRGTSIALIWSWCFTLLICQIAHQVFKRTTKAFLDSAWLSILEVKVVLRDTFFITVSSL